MRAKNAADVGLDAWLARCGKGRGAIHADDLLPGRVETTAEDAGFKGCAVRGGATHAHRLNPLAFEQRQK
jgi:hypothetical protein